MRRRDALKTIGALAGAAASSKLLGACGSDDGESGITTFVFLMMENRSFDHYLGARSLAGLGSADGLSAGLSNPNLAGNDVPIYAAIPADMCIEDPPHSWGRSRQQFNNGANDGFVTAYEESHSAGMIEAMAYMQRQHVPVHWALADAYTVCDRWFCSVMGPTLPNRMYWHAGTSNGATNNDEVLDGAFNGIDSLYHRLDDVGVDWGYYYGDIPVLSVPGTINTDGRIHRFLYDFIDHAAAGTLPPVVYIDPAFGINDDHPPHHPALGQQLVSAVYQALATSPQWKNCMLFITYDEHGGFYDHVPPPLTEDHLSADGFNQLGFRVPALAVGPYAKQGFTSSVQYDHTSPIKHLQNEFGLADLTARATAANDLTDCIDLERLAAGDPADPIQLPAVEVIEDDMPDSCHYDISLGPPTAGRDCCYEAIRRWAVQSKYVGKLDPPSVTRDYVYGIAEYLDHHNLGRIRRRR